MHENTNPAMGPDSIDNVLETVLGAYRIRVEITANVAYCGGVWFEQEPATPHGQFHLVTEGGCWITGEALQQPLHLDRGDLIVFPGGCSHMLSAGPDPHLPELGDHSNTCMLCGELDFLGGHGNPIFAALPSCFVIRSEESGPAFRQLAELLASNSRDARWGRQVMQNKLADSLFTMAVCEYVRRAEQPRGLLAALVDARLSKALAAVHMQPGEDWTIQGMAHVAGMSRTSFAELFTQVVGMPPIQYLAQWRATEARRLLKNRRFSVAAVAEMMGYRSEAAFRRFFKRLEGIGPGRARSEDDMG
ncbi:AraC family transcriptional regulator [Solilutibacter silvestris]|uniref:Cupin n=1 Tax=Solilutibacter silvestris TaxID=1645665 RepID=A0A2K1Q3T6_9GAMM|nr:AraC family transcriptional regulator [Lysobacter silvestris]PNS09698.1 Cupin [Lysobacter silvestris]